MLNFIGLLGLFHVYVPDRASHKERTFLMATNHNYDAIPDTLRNFDFLPDSAIVRDKTVAGLFGVSIPTVWRMAKDGRIPKPVKPSLRVTGWQVGGLRAALSKC